MNLIQDTTSISRAYPILDKAMGYMDLITEEAIEISLHPRNFNRDSGFTLSRSWCLVINMLKKKRHTNPEVRPS
jgi:hypothetical protein